MKDLKIAAVCMESMPLEIERNLDQIETFSENASNEGADLVCFPEFSVTGYIQGDPRDIYSYSESEEIVDRIRRIAEAKSIIIIAGIIEISQGEGVFISQVVAGPDKLIGVYRKTHLSPLEKEHYQEGMKIGVFKLDQVTIGVQLCYEAHFPEISTLMALKGVEVVFAPHASPRGAPKDKLKSWLRHLPGRAFDNSFFVVACNQVGYNQNGLSFPGGALILNPLGHVIASYSDNKEGMIIKVLKGEDLAEVRNHRMKYFIPNRRPELYQEISNSTDWKY